MLMFSDCTDALCGVRRVCSRAAGHDSLLVHRQLWTELAGLVSDGVTFTFSGGVTTRREVSKSLLSDEHVFRSLAPPLSVTV